MDEELSFLLRQAVCRGGLDPDLRRSLAYHFAAGGALIPNPNPAAKLIDLIATELCIDRLLDWISDRCPK